jgi:hypothetical protein
MRPVQDPKDLKNPRKRFSTTLRNIIDQCEKLKTPEFQSLGKSIESKISSLASKYQEIHPNELKSPKFQVSQGLTSGKRRISQYIQVKNTEKKTMSKEKFENLLRSEVNDPQTESFSFNKLDEEGFSYLLSNNKRKFAESFNSVQVSPNVSISHPVTSSNSKRRSFRKQKVMRPSFVGHPLSLDPRPSIKNSKRNSRFDGLSDKQFVYLNPEFAEEKRNLKNTLKAAKMVYKKHEQNRRNIINSKVLRVIK